MSIKNKIWEALDKDNYITDSELAEIYGREPNWNTAEEYKRRYFRLQKDREFFKDKEIIHAHKGKNWCMVDLAEGSYIVGRDFFDEIVKDMVKDNSRPDLKLEMYKR